MGHRTLCPRIKKVVSFYDFHKDLSKFTFSATLDWHTGKTACLDMAMQKESQSSKFNEIVAF